MSEPIKLRKGLNIKLKGNPERIFKKADPSEYYAVKPIDFSGLTPKLMVQEGDEVKAGSGLFFDKYHPEILFTSPVSGKISEIRRGERRKILEVVVKADHDIQYEEFKKGDPASFSREEIIENLKKSGVWPFIKQRPYGIIANPETTPKAIFISGFDTAPLAPDYDYLLKEMGKDFSVGIQVLQKLTTGDVHISLNAAYPKAKFYNEVKDAVFHYFKGKHPAGNVGIQIHHIDPLNKGEMVWTVNPQDVATIGRLFMRGVYDASRIIVLTGSEVKTPVYYKTINGASITSMVKDNVNEGELRYISGNVLTGKQIPSDGFIGFYDSQLTVMPEGKYYEFFGWATPGLKKFSTSRSFFSWLTPSKNYRLDTNMHGGERAFVMTGQYDKVLPMDIFPVHLLKSILVEDIDKMEQLGIYEVVEEDFALCEFVCTSKVEVQKILRDGINIMMKELG